MGFAKRVAAGLAAASLLISVPASAGGWSQAETTDGRVNGHSHGALLAIAQEEQVRLPRGGAIGKPFPAHPDNG